MPEIDVAVLVYVVPVLLFAGWVHGALGLGFPMVATPIIAIFIDVKIAILITLLPTATVNVASILSAKDVPSVVAKYWVLVASSLAGAVIGAFIISYTDPSPFRLVLAALIVLFLVTDRMNWRMPIKSNLVAMLAFGFVAGLAGGTTNVMVGVLIVYFLAINAHRSEMVPALNFCFLVGKLSQIGVFLFTGLISPLWLLYTVPLAIASFIALRVGQRFGRTLPLERYRLILRYLLVVLAIVLVVQFAVGF